MVQEIKERIRIELDLSDSLISRRLPVLRYFSTRRGHAISRMHTHTIGIPVYVYTRKEGTVTLIHFSANLFVLK